MFKQPDWLKEIKERQQAKQPKSEPYYDEEEITYVDIDGNILHIWKMKNGTVSWNVERLK